MVKKEVYFVVDITDCKEELVVGKKELEKKKKEIAAKFDGDLSLAISDGHWSVLKVEVSSDLLDKGWIEEWMEEKGLL